MSERDGVQLDRRQLLLLGMTGGAMAATSSCSLVGAMSQADFMTTDRPLDEAALAEFLKRMDTGLKVIETSPSLSRLVPGSETASPAWREEAEQVDSLGRVALRALTFTGMYRCLPLPNRQHPEVRKRLDDITPELDEAVFGMTATLAATDRAERRALQADIRRDPDLPLRISSLFEAPAREIGVPQDSLKQMRRIIANLGWRLRKQSPSLLFDEYVAKVEKAAAHHGQAEELKRHLATAAFRSAIWRDTTRHLPEVALSTSTSQARPAGHGPLEKKQPLEREKPALVRARREITAGQWVLGIGALTFAAGAAVTFSGTPLWLAGAVAMTVGGIIILAGLITAIVGGVRRSKNK